MEKGATSFSASECNWGVLVTVDNIYKYYSGPIPSTAAHHLERISCRCKYFLLRSSVSFLIALVDEYFAEMEAGATKKNNNVQKVAPLATSAIREGKL